MNLYDRVISGGRLMVAPLAGYPGVRLTGRSVREALKDPAVQLEALTALADRLAPDIVFTLLDLTVEAEALGLEVDFFERKPPCLAARESPEPDDFFGGDAPDPESSGRMPLFLQVAEGLASAGERMCGAFITGSFTLLAQLLGAEQLLAKVKTGEGLDEAIGRATAVVGEYGAALAERVDMVIVVDPAAEALEASEYRSFCRPYMGGLAGIIRASGAACMVHICGETSHLLEEMALAGVDGICLSPRVDLPRDVEELPASLVLMGNIDPRRVFQGGSAEDVRREVRRLLRRMAGARNFILSSGCDTPAGVPLRNLEAMMEEGRGWKPRSGMP